MDFVRGCTDRQPRVGYLRPSTIHDTAVLSSPSTHTAAFVPVILKSCPQESLADLEVIQVKWGTATMRVAYFLFSYGFWGFQLIQYRTIELFPGEVYGFSPIAFYYLAMSFGEHFRWTRGAGAPQPRHGTCRRGIGAVLLLAPGVGGTRQPRGAIGVHTSAGFYLADILNQIKRAKDEYIENISLPILLRNITMAIICGLTQASRALPDGNRRQGLARPPVHALLELARWARESRWERPQCTLGEPSMYNQGGSSRPPGCARGGCVEWV